MSVTETESCSCFVPSYKNYNEENFSLKLYNHIDIHYFGFSQQPKVLWLFFGGGGGNGGSNSRDEASVMYV